MAESIIIPSNQIGSSGQNVLEQVQLDLESLSSVTGLMFSKNETQEITLFQQKSYEWTFIGSGLTNRNFLQTFQEVSPSQIERLTAFSQQYC